MKKNYYIYLVLVVIPLLFVNLTSCEKEENYYRSKWSIIQYDLC